MNNITNVQDLQKDIWKVNATITQDMVENIWCEAEYILHLHANGKQFCELLELGENPRCNISHFFIKHPKPHT